MTVQNPQAPCRKNEQRGSGKQDLHQLDGEQARLALEAGHNRVDQPGGSEDAGQRDQRTDQKQNGKDRFGQLRGFLVPLFRPQAGIHGDE